MPFYNCHIHAFTSDCAPEKFLDIVLPRVFAKPVKKLVSTSVGRWLAKTLRKFRWSAPISRYATFVYVGNRASQKEVFEYALERYPKGARVVVLTLNLDLMGAGKPGNLNYDAQVQDIAQLRRDYPDQCLPFLCVDPRMGTAAELLSFVRKWVGPDKAYVGLKLYPALGYFPFDRRLEEVYRFAQDNNLPLMTHCTREGTYYVGDFTPEMGICEVVGGASPAWLSSWPAQLRKGQNATDCDQFLDPRGYEPVLQAFPQLKICFAHMGGSKEMGTAPCKWWSLVSDLMSRYPNVYTDISYTLSDKSTWNIIETALRDDRPFTNTGNNLPAGSDVTMHSVSHRILFGTDFFMTEQEGSEADHVKNLIAYLLTRPNGQLLVKKLTETNPEAYLKSNVYTP